VVVGGSVPAVHGGWMWDLTVPGNNDHDFYVNVGATSILVHNQNAPGCGPEEFVTNALGDLAGKRVTTGRIFDSAGNTIADELEAGGSSDLTKATDAYLRQNGAPINPRAAYYPASQHVEAQYAMWMSQNGVTDATVVMNNAEGVCAGTYGCQGAVQVILPEGSTMTVWYPGATEPVVIRGAGAP